GHHAPKLSPYTTLFRSVVEVQHRVAQAQLPDARRAAAPAERLASRRVEGSVGDLVAARLAGDGPAGLHVPAGEFGVGHGAGAPRSEEHTSELQSRENLV